MIRLTAGVLGNNSNFRGPQGVNGAAPVVRAPVVPGLGVLTSFDQVARAPYTSNLDKTGYRLIKRGCVVSLDARHHCVVNVRLGTCWLRALDAFGNGITSVPLRMAACSAVVVVRRV